MKEPLSSFIPAMGKSFTKEQDRQGATTLARAKLSGNTLVHWQDLLITRSRTDTSRHFGSRITFDEQGHLFFTVGDRGDRPNGQDLKTHAGSVLRLGMDGSVPRGNPFVTMKNRLWSIEHGPRGGDEGNLIAGALKLRHLNRVTLDDAGKAVSEERLLEKFGERIRALVESPEGWIYISTDSGKILRLRPQ